MAITRQDSWSPDDDLTLVTIVIDYIKTGKTQLEAFEVAGERLARTPAACGFRWNSFLRKQYTEEIQDAKALRMTLKGERVSSYNQRENKQYNDISIDDVIKSLILIKQKINDLNKENSKLRDKIAASDNITNEDVRKMFSVLQQVIKTQENEKEMPTG